jgi:uncharacterized membrane protein
MAVSVNYAAAYPLAFAGYTFPGYSAFYTVILNLVIAVVLTPVFRSMSGAVADQTVAADYRA